MTETADITGVVAGIGGKEATMNDWVASRGKTMLEGSTSGRYLRNVGLWVSRIV
jgi:hypothetical protein